MFIADSKIKQQGESLISPFSVQRVGPVSYDLTADEFHQMAEGEKKTETSIELKPLESAFVSCKEVINLPNDLSAIVNIRNSRLRQGLSLESPIYYPGHHSRVFFRLTNISSESITLNKGEMYAAIYFIPTEEKVDHPYEGKFTDEMDFTGMGDYTEQYQTTMHKVADKLKDVKSLEKSIYANVMVLMTIFVALFSVININVNLVKDGTAASSLLRLLIFNLGTVGSITALIACAQSMFKDKSINKPMLIISAICFLVAIVLALKLA